MSVKVFLSYRRLDRPDVAGRIRDSLADKLGAENVFFDVDSIPFGEDFRLVISQTVSEADAVVAVIGPDWGVPLLHDEGDFVRIEIETALKHKKHLLPVLVGGAAMPAADSLPGPLSALSYLNAALVRPDPDFRRDISRLLDRLPEFQQLEATKAPTRRTSRKLQTKKALQQIDGVDSTLADRILAEVGDQRRFKSEAAFARYAGVDPTYWRGYNGRLHRATLEIARRQREDPSSRGGMYYARKLSDRTADEAQTAHSRQVARAIYRTLQLRSSDGKP